MLYKVLKYGLALSALSLAFLNLDEDTSYEVFCLCREFVAKTARGNRRTRIMNKGKNYVEPCGILRRLAYNFKRGEIEYTAGQDYNEEMKTLRGIFD